MAQIYSSFGLRWGGRKPNPNDLTVASADGMQIATANLPAEGLIAFWATDFCGRFLGCGGGMGIIALSGPRLKKKRRCFGRVPIGLALGIWGDYGGIKFHECTGRRKEGKYETEGK